MSQKQLLAETAVDVYVLYQFIRKITTPFNEWPAFKLGIIDKNGEILKSRKSLKTQAEKNAFTVFDLLIRNIKRIIEKIPGGKSRLSSYIAGLYLIREEKNAEWYLEEDIAYESFIDFYEKHIVNEQLEMDCHILLESIEQTQELSEAKIVKIDTETAKHIGDRLQIDWTKIDIEQFRMGLEVEQEHSNDPETAVTHSILDIGKIALAHLKEFSNYYTRLKKVEEDAPVNSVSGGGVAGLTVDTGGPVVKKTKKNKRLRFKKYAK